MEVLGGDERRKALNPSLVSLILAQQNPASDTNKQYVPGSMYNQQHHKIQEMKLVLFQTRDKENSTVTQTVSAPLCQFSIE